MSTHDDEVKVLNNKPYQYKPGERQAKAEIPDNSEARVGNGGPRMKVLVERGKRYGEFNTQAALTQGLKGMFYRHMENHNPTAKLTVSEREAIDMIFHKISRIGNGDPHYKDSWVDIAGYATLVAEELEF